MDIRAVQKWRKSSGWVTGTNAVESGAFLADPQPGDTVIVCVHYFRGAGGDPGDLTNAPTDTDGTTFTQLGSTQFPQTWTGLSMWMGIIGEGGGGSGYRVTVSADNLDAISALGAHAWVVAASLTAGTATGAVDSVDDTHPFDVVASGGIDGFHLAVLWQQHNIYADDDAGGWNATGVNGFTSGMLAETDDNATFLSMVSQYKVGTGPFSVSWDHPGSPSSTNWGVIATGFTLTIPTKRGSAVFGENTDVSAPRAIAFGLDGNANVLDEEGKFKVFGNFEVTGNVTLPNLSLPDDSVTNAKLADMAQATIKGRAVGAGAGDPQDLTATQATAVLDAMVGDSGSGGTKGLVPAPASGDAAAGKFLKADGTWAAPSGGGGGGGINATSDVEANKPAAGNAGNLFLPTDGVYVWRDTGSVWQPWGPIFQMTPPVDGDFSWVNQGSTTKDASRGAIYLNAIGLGGNWRARVKTMPTPPFTITAWFRLFLAASGTGAGLCFRASSSDYQQWLFLDMNGSTHRLMVERYNPSFAGTDSNNTCMAQPLVCLRIADDNTNRLFSYSLDGVNFIQFASQGRTTNLTADQVGFGVLQAAALLLSWEEG